MDRARYKYMELTSEDPQAFGKQLTRALGELRAKGCEIVDVSMGLQPGPSTDATGAQGMLRVAQILILEPEKGVRSASSSSPKVMH